MHLHRKWILALAALAVWTVSARSEDAKDSYVPEEESIQVILLRHKAVREDLKLSDDQAKKIHEFTNMQWKKAKEIAGLSEAKRNEKFDVMAKENEKFLEDTLSAAQRKRLHQITMQVAGLMWVTRPDVASELKLTAEQKKKAHELQKEAHQEMRDLLHTTGKVNREEKFKELHELNHKRLDGLLTEEQRETWKKLAGEKFTGDLSKD